MSRLRYPEIAPDGYAALTGFGHYVNTATSLESVLLGLVYLKASLLNGCGFCIALHSSELRKHHEPRSRIDAVADWRSSDAFTPRERAALAWTEIMTNLQGSHASDEDYAAVTQFFREKELVDLTFAIANINAWNRLGVAFRPQWRPHPAQTNEAGAATKAEAAESAGAETTASGAETTASGADDGGKVAED